MSSSIRTPRACLAALLIVFGAAHCAESTCEETEKCGAPYAAGNVTTIDAAPEASQDSSVEASVDGGPADAVADGDADADAPNQAEADADTSPGCNGGEACGCTDLQTDPHHCGACGHECPTGTCTGGACEPLVIASGAFVPRYVTVDSTYVYWVNKGASTSGDAIMRIPKAATAGLGDAGATDAGRMADGAPPEDSAVTPPSALPAALGTGLGTVLDVASVDDYVYWSEYTAEETSVIWRADRWGAGRAKVAAPPGTCSTLLLDERAYCAGSDGLYASLSTSSDGGLQFQELSHNRVTPTGLVVGPTGIYWTHYSSAEDGELVQAVARGGGQPIPIAQKAGCAATTLALSSENVYWGCEREDATGLVLKAPLAGLDGGTGTIVATTASPWGMTVDGSKVYWCDARSGEIVWTPLNATVDVKERHVIGRYEDKESCEDGFAMDATYIYWTNARTGTVVKTVKP